MFSLCININLVIILIYILCSSKHKFAITFHGCLLVLIFKIYYFLGNTLVLKKYGMHKLGFLSIDKDSFSAGGKTSLVTRYFFIYFAP